jgi:NitT/TauT family transport system substrate-binding protein
MDTFGCTPKYLAENGRAARAMTQSYFEALEMIAKDPKKAYEIMGADVKQSGEQFGNSAKYLRWQDKAANQKFFAGELQGFLKEAGQILLEIGVIKSMPDVASTIDTSYIK